MPQDSAAEQQKTTLQLTEVEATVAQLRTETTQRREKVHVAKPMLCDEAKILRPVLPRVLMSCVILVSPDNRKVATKEAQRVTDVEQMRADMKSQFTRVSEIRAKGNCECLDNGCIFW